MTQTLAIPRTQQYLLTCAYDDTHVFTQQNASLREASLKAFPVQYPGRDGWRTVWILLEQGTHCMLSARHTQDLEIVFYT